MADQITPIGERLRKLRGESGLTQEALADRSGISLDLIKKLEQGMRKTARLTSLTALAQALDVPLSWLLDERSPPNGLNHGHDGEPAAGAVSSIAGTPRPRRTVELDSYGLESLRHELVATTSGDRADLADWQAVAWEYGRTYAATPPRLLLDDLARDLLVARDRLGPVRDDRTRADMRRVIAQLAVFMAHTLGNLGEVRASYRWWRVARGCADLSSDNEVRMWVYGREVIGGLYEHRPLEDVLALANEAAAITEKPGMGTGSVLIGRAQVLAALGRVAEAEQAMARVYATVDHLPVRVTSDTDSLYGWPEYRLRHGESFVYTYIGHDKKADAAQDRVLALYPEHMFRERAQVHLHQAVRMVRSGDPAGGARHAGRVLADLPEVQRTEVVLEVARSVARAVPVSEQHRSEVTDLREQLALSPPSLITRM